MAAASPAPVPLFSTHHSPVGAWSSLIFGAAGRGVTLLQDTLATRADLLVGVSRGGALKALPFAHDFQKYGGCEFLAAGAVRRTLTPCVDEFAAEVNGSGITFRVFTPQAALPNPKRSGNLQYATAPGLLLELVVDNSGSDLSAVAFVGVGDVQKDGGDWLRPVDWSSKTLCGVGSGSRWILAAGAAKGEVLTVLGEGGDLARDLVRVEADGAAGINPAAQAVVAGGIAIRVPPRSSRTVPLVWAVYQQGLATQGIDGRYVYTNYFPRVEAVANFLLHNSQRVRESCTSFDSRTTAACADESKLALFSQGVRAYNATGQVVEAAAPAGPAAYFATISPRGGRPGEGGGGGLRNDLARVVDHLPWALYRNPWVIRNLFDLATTAYAYQDKVRFPTDAASPDELREGGMTFSRDFGFGSAYAPGAVVAPSATGGPFSAFDGAGTGPGSSGGRMATEILLNSIYMLTSYALMADDTPWAKTRLPFARELLVSMENRDHWDPAQRTGILKAESAAAGESEQTVFNDFPAELWQARGNLYLAVKTFCANLLLTTYFQNNNDLHSADYSYAFAQKTAAALVAAFDAQRQILPANVLAPVPGGAILLAALEPLALPTYLGLTSTLPEYFPELFQALKSHAISCLRPAPEGCFDAAAQSLRLISTGDQTHPAKLISVLFVLERLFQVEITSQLPGVWPALAQSLERGSADPGLIAAALFVKPAAAS